MRGVAKFSFSNRVVNEWSILDEEIISGCSLVGFKCKLDRHLRDKRGYIYTSAFSPSVDELIRWHIKFKLLLVYSISTIRAGQH